MAENSAIEWTDHTFNPWEGCQKVGPGCDHCYAETRNARFGGGTAPNWGPGAPRRRTSAANWRKPLAWNAQAEKLGIRYRVFCASLADVFDNAVPDDWRNDLWELIARTPHLDWLLLTKRIGNVAGMLPVMDSTKPRYVPWNHRWPWPNVWIGATITSQAEADRDIPTLLTKVKAAKRFLSMEPLLGPVNLTNVAGKVPEYGTEKAHGIDVLSPHNRILRPQIDWVIVGGESGPGARPSHPDWFRALRNQCAAAGVPFLFKQWGEYVTESQSPPNITLPGISHGVFGPSEPYVFRVGKKAAGRFLDGVEHNGMPA